MRLFANNIATDNDNIEHRLDSEINRFKTKSWTAEDQEHVRNVSTSGMCILEGAFRSRLRLAIKDRRESTIQKCNKRLKTKTVEYEEYQDFNSNKNSMKRDTPRQSLILKDYGSFSCSSSNRQTSQEVN